MGWMYTSCRNQKYRHTAQSEFDVDGRKSMPKARTEIRYNNGSANTR